MIRPKLLKKISTPVLLTSPAVLIFIALLGTLFVMTFALSFKAYDHDSGAFSGFSLANYFTVATDSYFGGIFWRTIKTSLLTTFVCLVVGVPEAYIMSRLREPWRSVCLVLVLAPLLISVVVRTFGWSMILGSAGLLNTMLRAVDMPPATLLYTESGMVVALTHVMLPFMIIAVWTSLQKIDPNAALAAFSMGASGLTTLRRVIFPQILPGALSGSLIVFALSASAFATPALIGGRRLKVAATAIYDEYLFSLNWPLGATLAIILFFSNLLLMMYVSGRVERYQKRVLG